ncbi:hypothetical protein [Endozoicomonas sp. SCSIO W0465]|uniref:hypothetical protein n=1 Tax=Endozoicomonas sp. SCSIO W0465 TaxID=2918516 RepID=UPI002075FDB6|nr:hypothetical protein [Endozoicomonas sp. SCSIO W0465]USE38469.1 hypothetical protein MJO57_10050 [Endozoicomonas sp. SCSIO W0465]
MGITGAASGNELQHQQSIDSIPGILKPPSSQTSAKAKGFTGTRVVIKAEPDAIFEYKTEPMEQFTRRHDKPIAKRGICRQGCQEACFGKTPGKTIKAMGGGVCLVAVGLSLLALAGSGVFSSPNKLPSIGNATNSTLSLNLTSDNNLTKVLQNASSVASHQDDNGVSGAGGLYIASVVVIAWGLFGILLTRFCQSNDAKKTYPISKKAAGPSRLCSGAAGNNPGVKKTDAIAMEDFLTPEQIIAVNRNARLESVRGCPVLTTPHNVKAGCFTEGVGASVNAEYLSSDDSDESESSPFIPTLITVEVDVTPPLSASKRFGMVGRYANERTSSTRRMEGEYIDEIDEIAFHPQERDGADRLYHFIENSAFESLEPDVSRKFKRHLSKMSRVAFKAFANDVCARDEGRVRQSINNMVTRSFPDFGHEERAQLVQAVAEVIDAFPVSPPEGVFARDDTV